MSDFIEVFIVCLIPLAMGWWPCPSCCVSPIGGDCSFCQSSTTPQYIKMVVENLNPGTGTAAIEDDFVVGGALTDDLCETCPTMVATYKVKQETNPCHWSLELCHCATDTLFPSEIFAEVTFLAGDIKLLAELTVVGPSGSDIARYQSIDLGATPDCMFSNVELTHFGFNDDNDACSDWEGVKITVSSTVAPEDTEKQCSFLEWNTGSQYTATLQTAPTDDTCTDCNELTASVVLTQQDIPNCCRWGGTYVGSDCTYEYRLTVTEDKYELLISDDSFTTSAKYELTGLSFPHDGGTTRTLSFVSSTSSACTFSGDCELVAA